MDGWIDGEQSNRNTGYQVTKCQTTFCGGSGNRICLDMIIKGFLEIRKQMEPANQSPTRIIK
jgi:hypothetical protein